MSSLMTFTVRPATLRDARAIAELHNATVQLAYKDVPTGTPIPHITQEKRQAYWREAIEYSEPQVHIAQSEDGMLGFVGFDRSRDKGTPATMGEIWALHVSPAHWSKGVGQALWAAGREGLMDEGCTHVSIWVPADHTRAIGFFIESGFMQDPGFGRTAKIGNAAITEVRLQRVLSS